MKAYIRQVFWEDPHTAVEVVRRESAFRMVQSNHVYTETNAPPGFAPGDREQSFCMFQIREPVHRETIKAHGLENYRTDVRECVQLGRIVYDQAGGFYPWTEYHNILAMR